MSRDRALGAGEFLSQEARLAVRDIRQRLFEEAWFGRVVSGQPARSLWQDRDGRSFAQSFDDLCGRGCHTPESQKPDRDLDR